jgi:uncharacterized damage-inducible protein DinB
MQTESASFTAADLPRFLEEILVWDVKATAHRLRAASARVHELAAGIPDEAVESSRGWSAKEVLAHIAVLSRAYGVFGYMVAKGRLTELKLEDVITQRDTLGAELAARPVAEILAEIDRQHQRTLEFLAEATPEELKRSVRVEHGEITAEHLVRVPLVAHLEQHVAQLEEALA